MAQIKINYNLTEPTIIEQLTAQGYSIDEAEKYQKYREAILTLAFANILTEGMTTRVLQRLHNFIMRRVRPAKVAIIEQGSEIKTDEPDTTA